MNKHFVTGNLVADAVTRTTQSGRHVTSFRVASNEYYGEDTYTDFHECELWGQRGVKLQQYLTKGQKVLVEGRHTYPQSKKQDGSTFFGSRIKVREVELLGTPKTKD